MKTLIRFTFARRVLVKPRKSMVAVLFCIAILPVAELSAAIVEYDLTIARQEVNFTGQPVQAMTINGRGQHIHLAVWQETASEAP